MADLRERLLVHQAELQREQVLALRSSEAQKIAQATIAINERKLGSVPSLKGGPR